MKFLRLLCANWSTMTNIEVSSSQAFNEFVCASGLAAIFKMLEVKLHPIWPTSRLL